MTGQAPDREWQTLEAEALFPAAGMLAPWASAQQRLSGIAALRIKDGNKLIGAFALQKHVAMLRPVQTALTFSGLPLVARADALAELLAATGARFALLKSVPASGPFWDTLVKANRHAVLKRWERAGLSPSGAFEDWYDASFERKRRKEYRRLRARLAESGKLESLSLTRGEDPAPWTDDLLALEAKGWKGARGTAVAADPAVAGALKDALKELAESGNLRFWKLALDGRPLAMMFAMIHGECCWLGKIAYDEDHAKFSPGVLLVLDATEAIFAEKTITLADSCAIPGHPMIENIWRDRLKVADVMVAPHSVGMKRFDFIRKVEKWRRGARNYARDTYYYLRGKKRS